MNDKKLSVFSLGTVKATATGWQIVLRPEYKDALTGLETFSHVQVLFWFHLHDEPELRKTVVCNKPYKKGPEILGIFATRSDYRPNPIGLSICPVKQIDVKKGIMELFYIDAEENTPVIDIKPYHPGLERIKDTKVPDWCSHWPQWYEDSAAFDWTAEFNFPA